MKRMENARAKLIAAHIGWARPHKAPMAMPVKAEWPKASEKKDIRLWTTMVERRPKRGEMTNTARRAVAINRVWAHSKGKSATRAYQEDISLRPLSYPQMEDVLKFRAGKDKGGRSHFQDSIS